MKPNLTKIYLAVASFAEGVMPILEALAKVSRGLASEPETVAQPEAPAVTEPEAPAPRKRGPNKPKTVETPEPEVIVTKEGETAGIIEQITTEALQEAPTSNHTAASLLELCKPISGGTFDGAAEARKELTQLVKKYGGTISKMDPKHYDAFAAEAEAMIKQYVK